MVTLAAGAGALVFSGRAAILASQPMRGKASGLASLTGLVYPSFSVGTTRARINSPTVKSSVSVGRQDFKQVR